MFFGFLSGFETGPGKGTDLFTEQFDFSLPARVDFVGAGGKTGLILRLLEEYSQAMPVLYTTTTRIHPPHPLDGLVIISSDNEEYLVRLLERAVSAWSHGRRFVATHLESSPNLLRGVAPDFVERLDCVRFPVILNEADGARSMSLKMPRDGEPVLLTASNYLVPVIGLDCLNKPLGPETLFRWDMASHRYRLPAGEFVSPELAAALLLHPHGVCKDWRPGMRIVPYINKADVEAEDALAGSLARAVLRNGNLPIERVVYGSIHSQRASHICA
ncbi:MAG: selenium cofactor biosynthesis protein YqeC [Acidobacteriota bacterium]